MGVSLGIEWLRSIRIKKLIRKSYGQWPAFEILSELNLTPSDPVAELDEQLVCAPPELVDKISSHTPWWWVILNNPKVLGP